MWALHGVAVISLAAVFDRIFYWVGIRTFCSPITRSPNLAGTPPALANYAKQRGFVGKIVRAATDTSGGITSARMVAREHVQAMNRHLGTLELSVAIAPLLGILGTVLGIARAFTAGGTNGLPTPAALGAGVGLALTTTIWGLSISIFAAVARFSFRGFTTKALVNIKYLLERIEDEAEPVRD